ncbi:hypothetical protein AOLI_G00147890 [Acnodon oligacanthus]
MAESRHRLSKGLCLYCGKGDHFRSSCPTHPRTPPGDDTQRTSSDSCADTPSWIQEHLSLAILWRSRPLIPGPLDEDSPSSIGH